MVKCAGSMLSALAAASRLAVYSAVSGHDGGPGPVPSAEVRSALTASPHGASRMTLTERIARDMTDAMKARDAARLSALRMVKAALMNGEVSKGRPLDEPEAQQILGSLLKQRRDSIEQFQSAGRQDLVDKETAELRVLEGYAPPAVSAADLEQAVDAAIRETAAATPKDMGRVMKAVMASLAGRPVDGKAVNELVRKKLGA